MTLSSGLACGDGRLFLGGARWLGKSGGEPPHSMAPASEGGRYDNPMGAVHLRA
jgi:hypothetical protein